MAKKTEILFTRVGEEDKKQLEAVAEALDIPASQIVREAIKERLTALTQQLENPTQENTGRV